eukprot:TRINITY_DN3836_c0_g1_i1.p2 TRINITY_DN3836_c0_g1~~TRINITY_DN3836_c0_g1_i1.p2  ORF type:complete len:196 (-),score=22.52 TRINITY_DN3836_c0_g1_i1:535-1122(-)
MNWFSWFWSSIFSLFNAEKQARILLIGLDNAGKTSLLYKLKTGQVEAYLPTQRPQQQEIKMDGITFTTIDMGGHSHARAIWREYFSFADAIVFMVDSTDPERWEEAREELHRMMNDILLDKAPVVVLSNKIDLQASQPINKVHEALMVSSIESNRSCLCTSCSVMDGTGIEKAFKWITPDPLKGLFNSCTVHHAA